MGFTPHGGFSEFFMSGGAGLNMGHPSGGGGSFANTVHPQPQQPESIWHYFLRQLESGGQADGHDLGPPAGLYGGNANAAKNQVNTNAPGGRAAAKSLFRKLSKGKNVIDGAAKDGSIRRYTEDGSVQIRMKSDGTTNVETQGPSGKEDVHFK